MKRILLIVPSNKGTIAMCSLNLWKAFLQESSVEVRCVLVYKLKDGIEDFESCEDLSTGKKGLMLKLFNLYYQVQKLKKLKKEWRPDMTISTLFNCSTISLLAGGSDKKVGIFHSPHQQVKMKGRLMYLATLAQYKFLYPKLDYFACVSEEVKKSIIDGFRNIPETKVGVIYNVHLIDEIIKSSRERLDTEDDINIFSNKVILYCGRLDSNKAPDRLMRAYISSKAYEKCHLVFMGQDEGLGAQVIELAKQHHIKDKVHLIGLRKNPYKYIAKADVLVSTSYSEGLPGVIIEALALGIPIITTNSTRGVWEIFECADKYDKNLKETLILPDGMITPNTGNDKYDDHLLSETLASYKKENFNVPFTFINKVSATKIAEKFISLV